MLSIGTATLKYASAEPIADDDGAVGWLSEGRLVLTLISVQQQHVQAMMLDRLPGRYVHLDAVWPVRAGLGIDVATAKAVKTLAGLAQDTLAHTDLDAITRRFLRPPAG